MISRFWLMTLMIAVGAGAVIWHIVADPIVERVVHNSHLFDEPEIQPVDSRYYTELFERESGFTNVTDPVALPALQSFLQEHRLHFQRPDNSVLSTTEEGESVFTASVTSTRPVNVENILHAMRQPDPVQREQSLAPIIEDVHFNLTTLIAHTPHDPQLQSTHQHYVAATLALQNALQQFTRADTDPVGALLAADSVDEITEVLSEFKRLGFNTYLINNNGQRLALATTASSLGYPTLRLPDPLQASQVAGIKTENSACWLCLSVDEILAVPENSL